jgi:hypothetical protein
MNSLTPESPTLLLLYSVNSPACNNFRSMIRDEYMSHFKPICVDNKRVRDMLSNSTTLKIQNVPCVVEYFPDGRLASYEDAKAFEWMSNFMSILEGNRQTQPTAHTISLIPPEAKISYQSSPQLQQNPPNFIHMGSFPNEEHSYNEPVHIEPSLPGLQGRAMNSIDIPGKNPNVTSIRGPKRSSYRGMVEDNNYTGLTSERDLQNGELDRPMRGNGHNNLASTSLMDMDVGMDTRANTELSEEYELNSGSLRNQNEEEMYNKSVQRNEIPSRKVPMKTGRGIKMIEDLTPIDVEDDQYDEQPMLNDDDP